MNSQNYYGISPNYYHNINIQQYPNAMIKNGTVFGVNHNAFQTRLGDQSFNRNYGYSNPSVNNIDNAKLRKFNSYSAKTRYNTNDNNGINGYYVIPITNIPKRIITVKVPQNENIEFKRDEYNVENIVFRASPKKYNYKPYKKPKRKNNLNSKPCHSLQSKSQCHQENKNYKCNCSCNGCIKSGNKSNKAGKCYCNCPKCLKNRKQNNN